MAHHPDNPTPSNPSAEPSKDLPEVPGVRYSYKTDWKAITGNRYPEHYTNHQIMLREMQREMQQQPINTFSDGAAYVGGTIATLFYDLLMLICADENEKMAYFGTYPGTGKDAALYENIQSFSAGDYIKEGWNDAFSRQVSAVGTKPPSAP